MGSTFVRLLAMFLLGLALVPAARGLDPAKRFHHYVKDAWSIDQGLPQITVMAIAQDAEGYLWAGTQAGLARFDGVRFVNFNPDNTPALPGMLTQALLADAEGNLWVGTYKGLVRYRARHFTAIALRAPGAEAGFDVRALARSPRGEIYAAGPAGVFVVEGEALVPFAAVPAPASALHFHGDELWVGSERGAWRVADGKAQWFELPAQAEGATVMHFESADDGLYAGTSRGLYRLRGEGWRRLAPDDIPAVPIEALYADRDRNLWVYATDELLRLRGGRIVERVPDSSPAAHRALRAIFEDREGNLWLGSQWEGLARIWNGWTRRHGVDEGLQDPVVWSVARDPAGGVWIGGNDGLSHYRDGAVRQVLPGSALPHPNAYTLLAEKNALWIGTRRGAALLRDGRLEHPAAFEAIANTQIDGFLRDRRGTLWIATMMGLYRLEGEALVRLAQNEGLSDPRVRLLHETSDGRLLVGTQDGLYEHVDGRLQRVGENEGLPAHRDVTAIHELPRGELLVGTLSERLYHYAQGHWFEFTAAHGLPTNSAFFIADDRQGWVWVTGIRGVYRVPLEQLRAVRRGAQPRVEQAQMLLSERGDIRGSQKGFCCNGAGNAKGFIAGDTLWLPTRGGVVTFDSDWVVFNPLPPPVAIERLRAGQDWKTLAAADPVVLPLGQRDLGFEFTAPSFQQPQSVQLRYRLRGYHEHWLTLADPTRRDASYTNLPPGDYVFEVRAANNAGVWNPRPATVAVTVPAYLHETPAFFAVLGLLALALALAGHRWTTRRLRARQAALQAQVEQRTRDLADANLRLEEMSHTDALTGLRNRRYLQSQLPADLSFYLREVRKPGNEGTVMMLALADLDRFKAVNDDHGHHAGDLVLQQAARLMERQVRTGDYVVRWGGEEFLLVFRPMPWQEAPKIAERLRRAVAQHPFDIGLEAPLHLTVSIGFVEYPLFRDNHAAPDWQRMVELADRALYVVKHDGRNGWATFRPGYPMRVEDMLAELDHARGRGGLPHGVELQRSPKPS
jgi:diguanylate cyclase (GGDEF)-like protein